MYGFMMLSAKQTYVQTAHPVSCDTATRREEKISLSLKNSFKIWGFGIGAQLGTMNAELSKNNSKSEGRSK